MFYLSLVIFTIHLIAYDKFDQKVKSESQGVLAKSINYLNSIPYRINKEVLEFLLSEWYNEDSLLFNGLNKLKEVSSKPLSGQDNRDILSHNSQYWQIYNYNTLAIARLYQNTVFYLPTFADFRGRLYTLTQYLSYQGGDLARSLFARTNDVPEKDQFIKSEGIQYLKQYFANVAGQDKKSLSDRYEWVNRELPAALEGLAQDRNKFIKSYLLNLKEPLQFLSCMFAFKNIIINAEKGIETYVGNPILLDATCNGIQHLSALTRELGLAKNVNVGPAWLCPSNEEGIPGDIYSEAAKLVKIELDKSDDTDLLNLKINRSLLKKSVMTVPYNITLEGIKGQLIEYFPVYWENNKLFYRVTSEFTKNNQTMFLRPSQISKYYSLSDYKSKNTIFK